jgi:hypothetical protein
MKFRLEYHKFVNRPPIPASFALCGILFPLLLLSTSHAQISSTGHSSSVAPPTAMSVPPPTAMGVAPPTGISPSHGGSAPSHSPNGSHSNGHHPHHTATGTAYYPYIYAVPVPYAIDTSDADNSNNNNDADDDADYQGGPTIFDRRGSGVDSYVPPSYSGPAHPPADDNDLAESAPEPPQPPTTLVFKDGHQLEVNNYAIVSQTLYDLTPGHPRKIALADLDLIATQKQNDDHGVVFQLPPSSQAN